MKLQALTTVDLTYTNRVDSSIPFHSVFQLAVAD